MEMGRFRLDLLFCKNDLNLTQILQNVHVHTKILKIKEIKEKHFLLCSKSTGEGKENYTTYKENILKSQVRHRNRKSSVSLGLQHTLSTACTCQQVCHSHVQAFFLSGARMR